MVSVASELLDEGAAVADVLTLVVIAAATAVAAARSINDKGVSSSWSDTASSDTEARWVNDSTTTGIL